MKYYEFNIGDFPYYALIAANTIEDAKSCYILYIYEINDYDGEPKELTEDEMLSSISLEYNAAIVDSDQIIESLKFELAYIRTSKEPHLLFVDNDLFEKFGVCKHE